MSTPGRTDRGCWARWLSRGVLGLAGLYALLLIPEPSPRPMGADRQAFRWNRDALWSELEAKLRTARNWRPAERSARFNESLAKVQRAIDLATETNLPPDSPVFDAVETNFFELAPIAAACPEHVPELLGTAGRLRQLVKWQSEHWPTNSPGPHQRIYRLLYGSRAAVEEVLLQSPQPTNTLELFPSQVSPATPGNEVLGVKIHSGDIFVSRGGTPVSALIARGNDFPGNFSHIALVHVDEQTRKVSVIESHIESGVGVRSIEEYLADTKLRILVLRLRDDLPRLTAEPMLPHKVAALALSNAQARHIPYDFAMDDNDATRQFCSEVAANAYQAQGVTLWMNRSRLSTPGVIAWLGALGVRNFESLEPSDLEYDPQLRVVAEWRDPETLFKDHVDNAVIDAMLEGADHGKKLDYDLWMLPLARLMKTWSMLLNACGKPGPIPEGMSATTALRVEWLKSRHAAIKAQVVEAARRFQVERGYVPPYWELVRMAREATAK
jgi:hypothetical protein